MEIISAVDTIANEPTIEYGTPPGTFRSCLSAPLSLLNELFSHLKYSKVFIKDCTLCTKEERHDRLWTAEVSASPKWQLFPTLLLNSSVTVRKVRMWSTQCDLSNGGLCSSNPLGHTSLMSIQNWTSVTDSHSGSCFETTGFRKSRLNSWRRAFAYMEKNLQNSTLSPLFGNVDQSQRFCSNNLHTRECVVSSLNFEECNLVTSVESLTASWPTTLLFCTRSLQLRSLSWMRFYVNTWLLVRRQIQKRKNAVLHNFARTVASLATFCSRHCTSNTWIPLTNR